MPTDGPATGLGTHDLLMIHQLLAYYGHVVDDRDWARFDELFTPDAILDYTRAGAGAVFTGLDEIRAFFRDANHPSAHHVLNIVVTESGGEVRVRSKFFVPYTRETHMPKRWFDEKHRHSHVALDDAIEQGSLFCNMLAELRTRD